MSDIEQGSEAWHDMRRGKMSASRLSDVLAQGKGVSRANYLSKLVCERLTGKTIETYKSYAMERGAEIEEEARAAYEFYVNIDVVQVPFIDHPTIEMCGASPDGLVGDVGLVEFKCPEATKHIKNLEGGSIDGVYRKQMQWQMACTERKWCDFVSYNPDFKETMKFHVQRVERDEEMIKEVEPIVIEFLNDVSQKVEALIKKYDKE